MAKDNSFTPRELKGRDGLVAISVLSRNYFTVAQDLRERSKYDQAERPGHYYVFPAVIMYAAALEAFFSELLALELYFSGGDKTLELLKNTNADFSDFKTWLREIFERYNRAQLDIDFGGELFQNVIALKELRNSAAHYNPRFISHIEWPKRLHQVLNKSRIDVLNSGWETNLSTPIIADWAYGVTKDTIETFCRASGNQNPFKMATHGVGNQTSPNNSINPDA